ncbi:phenylalanine--tRNA ligase alpha subunit, cytoplasmic, partial [Tanacetum coccineum]
MLWKKRFKPKRYYSIDRVFRNEAVDKTHLAEFHQVEDQCFKRRALASPRRETTLALALGVAYHEGLKKWIEVGNSGMLRLEVLLPMGFPEDVVVIAWGLSFER